MAQKDMQKNKKKGQKKELGKDELIDILVKTPEKFTENKFKRCEQLFKNKEFTLKDMRPILLRIFDTNNGPILNRSEANMGLLGVLNKRSRIKRNKLFWKKVKKAKFSKIILAEGDSWFEYPIFVKDIIDHLNSDKHGYAIYSQAYGGDWLSNILYEHEYIEELSLLKPDVFLISGGGNDLVGSYRLAHFVRDRKNVKTDPITKSSTFDDKIRFANTCFNVEFWGLLKLLELQYRLLFKSIEASQDNEKFKSLRIITQGYDYAIPSSKWGVGIVRPITNILIDNGRWLKTPLLLRGYQESEEQRSIVLGMIEHLNNMLIRVGQKCTNVYHIDSRGSVDPETGWYNELHPNSKEFSDIANTFVECIEAKSINKKRVYTTPPYQQ